MLLSRAAALSLLAALLGLIWASIMHPILKWCADRQEAHADLVTQLSRMTLVAERRPAAEASVHRLEVFLSDSNLLWSGSSQPAISALIQARLRDAVTATGANLRSTTDLPAATEHGLSRITLRLETDGPMPALQTMLGAIEASTPSLFIDGLTINAPDTSAAPGTQPTLSVQLDVTGYSRMP